MFQLLERHGISAFLVIAGGYYLAEEVGKPLVSATTEFMTGLHNSLRIIQQEVMAADLQETERWAEINSLNQTKLQLIHEALAAIKELEDSNDDVARELAELRNLLARSPLEDLRRRPIDPTNPQSQSEKP